MLVVGYDHSAARRLVDREGHGVFGCPRKPVKTWTIRDQSRLFFFREKSRKNSLDQRSDRDFLTMTGTYTNRQEIANKKTKAGFPGRITGLD